MAGPLIPLAIRAAQIALKAKKIVKGLNKAKKVDYIISIASNQIFKEDLLNAPKEICLNIHASLLPRNRGYNPSFWVLYKNENYTGVTLHKMEITLDTGPILLQKTIKINPKETWYSLQERVICKAGEILNEILPHLINKSFKMEDQEGLGSLFKKPHIIHGKIFRKRNKRFI